MSCGVEASDNQAEQRLNYPGQALPQEAGRLTGEGIMLKAWMDFAFDSALLCAEAQEVMALRLMTLASGGAHAQSEAQRMVAEKGIAFAEARWQPCCRRAR
jgi:hypothetical protein